MANTTDEDGFGMIEIVVSMFMLALLAIAFLPVLIQGLRTTASNASFATATQLVNQSLELARASNFTSCAAIQAFANEIVTEPDGRGTDLRVTRSLPDGCTLSDSEPERLVVSVAPANDLSHELARATTHILVG